MVDAIFADCNLTETRFLPNFSATTTAPLLRFPGHAFSMRRYAVMEKAIENEFDDLDSQNTKKRRGNFFARILRIAKRSRTSF